MSICDIYSLDKRTKGFIMSYVNYGKRVPIVCYQPKPKLCQVDPSRVLGLQDAIVTCNLTESFVVPKRSGRAWRQMKGEVCRISLISGPQVPRGSSGA